MNEQKFFTPSVNGHRYINYNRFSLKAPMLVSGNIAIFITASIITAILIIL